MTRSWQSAKELVNPQATRLLWPMITKGSPGMVTPVDSKSSPAWMCAAYQIDGMPGTRWGSLQRIGRPEDERSPETTHELLIPPAVGIHRAASRNIARSSDRTSAPPEARSVFARMVGLASG